MRALVPFLAVLATSACTLPAPSSPSPGPWRFSGTVFAVDGAGPGRPLAGAELTIVEGVNKNASVISDAAGHYKFAALESGRFTLTIAARGFVSATPVVELHHDTETDFALRPR